MSKQYTYIEKKYPASPRSKRRRETGEGASLGGATVLASTSTGGVGVTDHGELSGIVSTGDEYSEFARDIHLTAADAEALKMDRSAAADVLCGCVFCILTTV